MRGKDFSSLKEALTDVLIATICPIGEKIIELKNDKSYLFKVLKTGSDKAKEISDRNLNKIKEIVGFI